MECIEFVVFSATLSTSPPKSFFSSFFYAFYAVVQFSILCKNTILRFHFHSFSLHLQSISTRFSVTIHLFLVSLSLSFYIFSDRNTFEWFKDWSDFVIEWIKWESNLFVIRLENERFPICFQIASKMWEGRKRNVCSRTRIKLSIQSLFLKKSRFFACYLMSFYVIFF